MNKGNLAGADTGYTESTWVTEEITSHGQGYSFKAERNMGWLWPSLCLMIDIVLTISFNRNKVVKQKYF